jgi:hypothetical protein
LKQFRSSTRVFATAIVAALALSAIVASSASASIVPAKFSSELIKLTTTEVTLKRAGGEAKTCTLSPAISLTGEGKSFWGGNREGFETRFTCGLSTLQMVLYGEVFYDTVAGTYTFYIYDYEGTSMLSPYGIYWQETVEKIKPSWTNGSGATASTVTFKETPIGHDEKGKMITMTGTFKATDYSTGGLVTLSH